MEANTITVEALIEADIQRVWACWTGPEHIVSWNFASADWHCPKAENDLRTGGKFCATMASKDGAMSFEFEGVYDEVVDGEIIAYTMPDGRKVKVAFTQKEGQTLVTETFDPENIHSPELQKTGWQAILNQFKTYVESLA